MTTSQLPESTLHAIEPIVERALSLRAAADMKITISDRLMVQSRTVGVGEAVELAGKAQGKLNEAQALLSECNDLLAQARRITKESGHSLPGMDGLRAISDRYTERLHKAA